MAVDSLGTKGQPQFDGNKRSNTATDQNAIGDYAAMVGNRIVGTAAQMGAMVTNFGAAAWDGLEYFQLDTGDTYVFVAASNGFEPAYQSGPPADGGFFTPSSGWSMTSGSTTGTNRCAAGINGIQAYVSFFRSGAALTVPADGNMTNVVVGRVSAGFYPLMDAGLGSGRAGRTASFVIGSDGYVSLVSTTGSQAIETGDPLSFCGFYLFQ